MALDVIFGIFGFSLSKLFCFVYRNNLINFKKDLT
jgi:hypothetical protein